MVEDGAKKQQPNGAGEDAGCAEDKMDAIFHCGIV
jgi:hypothetical protein